jgi:hypothetical protein
VYFLSLTYAACSNNTCSHVEFFDNVLGSNNGTTHVYYYIRRVELLPPLTCELNSMELVVGPVNSVTFTVQAPCMFWIFQHEQAAIPHTYIRQQTGTFEKRKPIFIVVER